MKIQFEDPPESALLRQKGAGGRYVEFAIALRAHPGKWAILPSEENIKTEKSATHTGQNIKRGALKGFTKGEYDAVVDGLKVYVRFIPPAEQPKSGDDDDEDSPEDGPDVEPVRSLAPKVRAWAKEQGIEVAERGALPKDLVHQYLSQRGDPIPPRLRSVKGK